jgi:hypothetical protein
VWATWAGMLNVPWTSTKSPTYTGRRNQSSTLPAAHLHLGEVVKRAALDMRVSTKGHGQTTETQALALSDYAGHRGFEIVGEI